MIQGVKSGGFLYICRNPCYGMGAPSVFLCHVSAPRCSYHRNDALRVAAWVAAFFAWDSSALLYHKPPIRVSRVATLVPIHWNSQLYGICMEYNRDNFLEPIEGALGRVQSLFDVYQNEKFERRSAEFFCLELCGEAGELANLQKKRWKGKEIDNAHIADEAADVLIALMNYANAAGVNLAKAVAGKLERIERKRSELEQRGEAY